MNTFLLIISAYLIGSIPTGLVIARLKGVDLRTVGSGNIGATNVGRALGKKWAVATFIGDALKGFVPAFAFPLLCGSACSSAPSLGVFCGVAAIAGHVWPVYLRFKGGKGVATSAGVLLGIAPIAALLGAVIWYVLFSTTRYVSLASIGASIAIPPVGWLLYAANGLAVPIALTGLAVLVIAKHWSNILRLLKGTESKFARKKH